MSCASVREHRIVTQPLNTQLTSSVGSTLFRLNKRGDLPNAVGGRDIFGGKIEKGYAEVKLKSIRDGGVVELIVFDVNKDTAETTMDRYRPFDNSATRINVSQTIKIGNQSSEPGILVTVDTRKEKEYIIAGIRVNFIEIRPSSVIYTLQDIQRH
jgi:hypothetical protein